MLQSFKSEAVFKQKSEILSLVIKSHAVADFQKKQTEQLVYYQTDSHIPR